MSLSETSFYRDDLTSVSVPDQPATEHASNAGAATSDGVPQSEINSAAEVVHSRPVAPQSEGAETLTQSASGTPAEQPAQPSASAAQRQVPAPVRVPDQEPAAGALQPSSPCASLELGADPAGTPLVLPSPPSLQSWGNNTNDQCSLASKSVSLDLFLAAGGASPRRSNTFSRASPGPAAHAEPEQSVSLQQPVAEAVKGSEDAVSAAKQAQAESSPALHHGDNAPAFWEGRRRSSSSSGHVHGSSAALSALAQAYSRAGQGSPAPAQAAQEAQAQQLAASERSPLETSELLRVMAMKIDSQTNLQDMAHLPSPALQANSGACSTPSDLESRGATTGAVAHNAPQKEPVSEHWGSMTRPGPANPFAAACEQTDMEAKAQTQRSQAPSSRAGVGSTGLPARDAEAEKSVAALSMRCEAGSCIAPTSQCSPFESGQTVSQGRSNAHSSPDSWNGNTSPGAIARAGGPSMLAGGSSGRLTPLDRSQHSTGRSRMAGRTSSQLSAHRQSGSHEGVWDGQRSQAQGATSGSAPNSGSNRKSSALEDSAKESICPAELETMERAWVAMGGNASATEKLRQQAAWQKQTFNPRDSAASASQAEGPYASGKGMRNLQQAQSTSRRSDVEASCENHMGSRVPLSRSGKSGLSVSCTPVSDGGYLESAGSACSRLTATNLTEFDNLQRQVSRKDKPRSPLHERTHAWLAQAELPAEFEYSAKRAAKLKERCDSYSARISNPFDTRKEAPAAPQQPATKKPNVFKRFIACITIEPW